MKTVIISKMKQNGALACSQGGPRERGAGEGGVAPPLWCRRPTRAPTAPPITSSTAIMMHLRFPWAAGAADSPADSNVKPDSDIPPSILAPARKDEHIYKYENRSDRNNVRGGPDGESKGMNKGMEGAPFCLCAEAGLRKT